MNVTSIRRALVPGVAALAVLLSACSGDAEGDSGDGGDADLATLTGEVAGGGASSQEAAQLAWIAGFTTVAPEVTVTYDPVGSGGGRESFISGAFAFAGTDSYLTDEEGELSAATERCGGEAPLQIPNYLSPIAIIYNVEGVDDLKLSPEALAGIFAGKITSWDDPAIAATNEGAPLPDAAIDAVHRSDESGTTENFTDYLDAVAASVWDAGVVETWPSEYGGQGAQGTSGVVDAVANGTNSIGYADASQAGGLDVAKVGVGEDFVAPTPDAAAKILEVSPPAAGASDTALIFDLDHTTAEAGTYPIVLTSYLIACRAYSGDEAAAGELAKGYLSYIVSEEGQQFGAEEAGSAPLSDDLAAKVRDVVAGISVG